MRVPYGGDRERHQGEAMAKRHVLVSHCVPAPRRAAGPAGKADHQI
jgi:hypothetical protein